MSNNIEHNYGEVYWISVHLFYECSFVCQKAERITRRINSWVLDHLIQRKEIPNYVKVDCNRNCYLVFLQKAIQENDPGERE